MRKNNRTLWMIFAIILGLSLALPALNLAGHTPQAQDTGMDVVLYLPLIRHHGQPPASTSYYLPTVDEAFLYSLGCEQGVIDLKAPDAQDSVSVLDFSYPVYDDKFGYGAALFEDTRLKPTPPVSIEAIKQAVKHFALGYYNCSGEDTQSTLVIGVGTNNKGLSIETTAQATEHGIAWGAMVSELNQWALDQKIIHQVQFYGASNIESWNTPEWTYAWISGFEQNKDVFMLHFGDAAGCPYDRPYFDCNEDWNVNEIWYVSWGAPSALPLPLIYRIDGIQAKQWAYLSRYSVENHGYRIDFTGVFTNWQYCQQYPDYCLGWNNIIPIDNTPEEAYLQMMEELNKDPATVQTIRWKTDIRWVLEGEVTGANSIKTATDVRASGHPINEEIAKIEQALQLTGLSETLRTSLETKQSIYQKLANKILESQQTPAPKD